MARPKVRAVEAHRPGDRRQILRGPHPERCHDFPGEARRVARPLIYEHAPGFSPTIKSPNEIVSGIESPLPPITGYVMTTLKENPLVEVEIVSPRPEGGQHNTILATWTYGLGRTAAFTTDDGPRVGPKVGAVGPAMKSFFATRPLVDAADRRGGQFHRLDRCARGARVKSSITALDKDDEFLNFLNLAGVVIGPNMEPREISVKQAAPVAMSANSTPGEAGSYFVMLSPGPGQAPLRTGLNVPYSAEFRTRGTNEALLDALASLHPLGGARARSSTIPVVGRMSKPC